MEPDLDVTRRGDWTVVTVHGDLDLARGPAFRQRVLQRVAAGEHRVVVDFTPCDFVDSIGLGMLVAVLKRVRAVDGSLAVVCPEPRLRKLFELTGLETILPPYGDVAEVTES
ncbi:MAG: STAS domain-containing protein [Acidimicrobiia bacterium]|nr:STAS domain-containing protein [Acidimicrobiia bacterium]